jgi:hypothetical protein
VDSLKELTSILRKIVTESKRDWDVKLTAALWAYHTTYKDQLAWLESLNERRQLAAQHVEVTQRHRKVAFDKRQKTCKLLPDMWVMLQDARKLEFSAKFDALWIGPYIIKEVFPNNSVQLKTLDGVDFPTCTNGSHCKKYKV